jgi:hypothetical protein
MSPVKLPTHYLGNFWNRIASRTIRRQAASRGYLQKVVVEVRGWFCSGVPNEGDRAVYEPRTEILSEAKEAAENPGGAWSLERTILRREFPGNREKYRETPQFLSGKWRRIPASD